MHKKQQHQNKQMLEATTARQVLQKWLDALQKTKEEQYKCRCFGFMKFNNKPLCFC